MAFLQASRLFHKVVILCTVILVTLCPISISRSHSEDSGVSSGQHGHDEAVQHIQSILRLAQTPGQLRRELQQGFKATKLVDDADLYTTVVSEQLSGTIFKTLFTGFAGYPSQGPENIRANGITVSRLWSTRYLPDNNVYGMARNDLHHVFPIVQTIKPILELEGSHYACVRQETPVVKVGPADDPTDRTLLVEGGPIEVRDSMKGDLARAFFYMRTMYGPEDWELPQETKNFFERAKYDLRRWNDKDPVSREETERNLRIQQIQGNLNPFISEPKLVERVHFSTQAQSACHELNVAGLECKPCERSESTPTPETRPADQSTVWVIVPLAVIVGGLIIVLGVVWIKRRPSFHDPVGTFSDSANERQGIKATPIRDLPSVHLDQFSFEASQRELNNVFDDDVNETSPTSLEKQHSLSSLQKPVMSPADAAAAISPEWQGDKKKKTKKKKSKKQQQEQQQDFDLELGDAQSLGFPPDTLGPVGSTSTSDGDDTYHDAQTAMAAVDIAEDIPRIEAPPLPALSQHGGPNRV